MAITTVVGVTSLVLAFALQCFAARGADPVAHAYGATSWTLLCWQGLNVALTVVMAIYALARMAVGKIDAARRATFDSTWLVWLYTSAQGLLMLPIS
jgi:cytochrome c oxidase subunit I+III